jgi:hypothetical protein
VETTVHVSPPSVEYLELLSYVAVATKVPFPYATLFHVDNDAPEPKFHVFPPSLEYIVLPNKLSTATNLRFPYTTLFQLLDGGIEEASVHVLPSNENAD